MFDVCCSVIAGVAESLIYYILSVIKEQITLKLDKKVTRR